MRPATKTPTKKTPDKSDFLQVGLNEKDIIETHSKSFGLASRLLPKSIRADVRKLYSWCRWCDNSVDDAPNQTIATQRLEILTTDIDRIFKGQRPKLQTSQWMEQLIAKYSIPRQFPHDLLLGMESDLFFESIRNQSELETYCYRVAGVVGKMMCCLFGIKDEEAFEKANRLGMAMQMTNIARDIAEDWNRNRCYLPISWLNKLPPGSAPSNEYFRDAVAKLLDLAETNYQLGAEGYSFLPDSTRFAIRFAASVYRGIGSEIIANNYQVLDRRHYVSTFKKALVCLNQSAAEFAFRMKRAFGRNRRSIAQ